MLRTRQLQEFIGIHGGADDQLYRGSNVTGRIGAELALRTERGRNDYKFTLAYAQSDSFVFTQEAYRYTRAANPGEAPWQYAPSVGGHETAVPSMAQASPAPGVNPVTARVILRLLRSCQVFQFHDTSGTAAFKKRWDVEENGYLRTNGGNLAAVLYRLEQEDQQRFDQIARNIRRVLPVFDRFQISESHGKVSLRWRAVGGDKTYGAHLTSDGSLRFFALVTLLNLPIDMLPNVILLDEPELGLHPFAVTLIGCMIKSLAADRQIIVATQSPLLVDAFELDEIVVLDLKDGRTTASRPDVESYKRWLEDGFVPGELWQKNLIGGQP